MNRPSFRLRAVPVANKRPARAPSLTVAAITCALLAPDAALAAPILESSPVTVRVSTQVSDNIQNFPIRADSGNGLETDVGLVTLFESPARWGRFPTSPGTSPTGYVQTLMTFQAFGAVAVTGSLGLPGGGVAIAEHMQTITNTGDAEGDVLLSYTIPAIEASVQAGSLTFGPQANANALMVAQQFLADGTLLATQTVFQYTLQVFRDPVNRNVLVDRSADLEAEQGLGILSSGANSITGVSYAQFTGFRPLATLEPGERLELHYLLLAEGDTGGRSEAGFQALVGDPFNLGTGQGFTVSLATDAPVPEPATLSLLVFGLLAMAVARSR